MLAGCAPPPAGSVTGNAGQAGLALVLAPGVMLDSAAYTVTGPGGLSRSGTINLTSSTMLTAIIGGLPAGTGYSVVITAMSSGISCSGSATFDVLVRQTTSVTVSLRCRETPRTGSAAINERINLCPVVDQLTALPAEVRVGSSLALTAAAHDGDNQPVSYQWAAASGTFSNAAAAAPSFTCTAVGPVVVTVTASDGDCSDSLSATITCSPADLFTVAATVETDPVPGSGDAADDPAVWINPADPALSTIIGTDKTAAGGLGVYDLSGHQIQFMPAGALNNVDLRDGFPLSGTTVALVTAGNRTNNSIAIFKVDAATRQLVNVAARTITTLATYGSCMYHSPQSGKFYYFVDSKAGEIEQWELFDNGAGLVDAIKIRNLPQLGSQPEACVVDDELGHFYIGEEDVGIWKFGAEPSDTAPGVLVDSTGPGGHLVADVEGLAIARTGAGTGFLLTSNQGNSTYAVYTREGNNTYVKTFRVGSGAACIDEATGSDGIEVTTAALGPAFPSGVFITQDDTNTGPAGNQNFKLVPLQDILNGGPGSAEPICQPGGGGSDAGAPMSDAGTPPPADAGAPGFPEAFCAAFCGKCETCWNPAGGFSEGDCLYMLAKPSFALSDCMAGCAAGRTPGFPPANLPANWESLACLDFDNSI